MPDSTIMIVFGSWALLFLLGILYFFLTNKSGWGK
jgi:hypothetical protein